jgi:glyoxylase-like metal-dependent hydrolase (beta-lactamase superfamily II)
MQLAPQLHWFPWQSATANNCNTYLIDGTARVLIDPGHKVHFVHVRQGLADLGLDPADLDLVVATHAHPDHLEAVEDLRGGKARFALHARDWELACELAALMGPAGPARLAALTPDLFLTEGALEVAGLRLEVWHTPGHSPGSICLYWPEAQALFCGDLVFRDGVGRTDLPGGSGEALSRSLAQVEALAAEWLLPGHGPVVQGAAAIRANFARVRSIWAGYL